FFPSIPVTWVFNPSNDITATVVLDPNGPVLTGAPATLTGTFGTIAITRAGVGTAASAFQVEPESSLGELLYGCNLNLTQSRFVEFSLNQPGMPLGGPGVSAGNWLPSSLTQKLFSQLGVDVGTDFAPRLIPGVALVLQQQCSAFPTGNAIVGNVPLSQLVNALKVKPTTAAYPDRTIAGNPNPQWYPGFLILQVTIGFWGPPSP
ncbi:MAG TPA: hypothetical protein VK132_09820, partial [Gemmatimonadales bacterium]|nr:hypothetical protein [Gemmatimonadales bacterium]